MLDVILYTTLTIGVIVSLTYVYLFKNRLKKSAEIQMHLLLDRQALVEKLSTALDALETKPVEQTDGFLQYLEATRDSAFEFIETMQKSIKQFENDTKSVFEKQRLSEDLKTIKKAYAVLKENTLPQDTPNN